MLYANIRGADGSLIGSRAIDPTAPGGLQGQLQDVANQMMGRHHHHHHRQQQQQQPPYGQDGLGRGGAVRAEIRRDERRDFRRDERVDRRFDNRWAGQPGYGQGYGQGYNPGYAQQSGAQCTFVLPDGNEVPGACPAGVAPGRYMLQQQGW